LAGEIVLAQGALQANIVKRKNVGAQLMKDQEHFRCPPANSPDGRQFGNDVLVTQMLPGKRIESANSEMVSQIAEILDFSPGESATLKTAFAKLDDPPWRYVADLRGESPPDRIGGLDGNLLADNRTCQRPEGVTTRDE